MTPPAHPGALLRNKRIENGWSLAEVARALYLPVRRVEALENDDYHNLPGKTYILGYWKIYAALLGISIEDSLEAHKENLPEAPADLSLKSRRQPYPLDEEPPRHRLALLCVLLSVIFLVAVWYWPNPQPHSVPPTNEQPTDEVSALSQAAAGIALPPRRGGNGANGNGYSDSRQHESLASLPEPNFSAGALPLAEETEFASHVDAPAVDEASPSPAKSSLEDDKIVFAFADDTWLEVRDDAGERLIYRMVERGQRLTLTGRPPFSVFVGNAAGVAVEYQGRQVPFTAQGNATFARFTVGTR